MQFLWGPICFIIVLMITYNHPLRHPLQALVATGQLYGLLLYYATSMFDLYYRGVSYSRPERYYFWMYFFLANFIWVVIPGSKSRYCEVCTGSTLTCLFQTSFTTVSTPVQKHSRLWPGKRRLKQVTVP